MLERLQKIIARAGVTSRRHAEQLIESGQVTVNGQVVTKLGTKADAARDHVKVSGRLLHFSDDKLYVMLHKPPEVVATMSDPEGRPSLANFLHGVSGRVYPVGRLEYHAAGLVLLTNDGEFANRILRAHRLPQTYWLKVKGQLNAAELNTVSAKTGVKVERLKGGANPWYQATLTESSSDKVRQALLQLMHPVEKLKRVKLSDLDLASLLPGRYRLLTREEVARLERAVTRATGDSRRPSPSKPEIKPAAGLRGATLPRTNRHTTKSRHRN